MRGALLARALAAAVLCATPVLCVAPGAAEPLPPGLALGESADARQAIDGDTLVLADGRELRLAAVGAPRPLLPRGDAAPARDRRLDTLAAAAREALDAAIRGRRIDIYFGAQHRDRHGRLVAHVVAPTIGWVQRHLVERGLARVETLAATAAGAGPLLASEAAARGARRGLWDHPLFQVRSADESGRWLDTFQLVEGTVGAVDGGRTVTRLEIGGSERRLTIVLSAAARRELREAGVELPALVGRPVRVRGWISWRDGARIDLDHAAPLELPGR